MSVQNTAVIDFNIVPTFLYGAYNADFTVCLHCTKKTLCSMPRWRSMMPACFVITIWLYVKLML